MQILTKFTFFILFFLFSASCFAKGGPSLSRAGLIVSGEKKLGTDTTMLTVNNNSATATYTIDAQASGTTVFYVGRNGRLKVGSFSTASRTALINTSGEIVYDSDLNAFYTNDGSGWTEIGTGGGGTGAIDSINGGTGLISILAGTGLDVVTTTDSNGASITLSIGSGTANVGELYTFENSMLTQVLSTQDVWYKIDQWENAGYTASMTVSTSNNNITNLATGSYLLGFVAGYTGTTASTYEFSAFVDGVRSDKIWTMQPMGAGTTGAVPLSGVLYLPALSEVDIRVRSRTANNDTFNMDYGNFSLVEIAGTRVASSTGGGTSTPVTVSDTAEVNMILSGQDISAELINNSIIENRISIANGPSQDFILSYNGTGFYWASGTTDLGLRNNVFTTTTPGDLIYRDASSETRLPIGTLGQVLTVNGSGYPEWSTGSTFQDPMTTLGDTIYYDGITPARLPIGTVNQILSVSGVGIPEWITAPTADGEGVSVINGASGAFVIAAGSNVTIGQITSGATTTLTINSTAAGGGGSDAASIQGTPVSNASPTITLDFWKYNNGSGEWEVHQMVSTDISDFSTAVGNNADVSANTSSRHDILTVTDSSEIDFTLSTQDLTGSIIDGSINESRLNISNAPVASYVLSYDGANLIWSTISDAIGNYVSTFNESTGSISISVLSPLVLSKVTTVDGTFLGITSDAMTNPFTSNGDLVYSFGGAPVRLGIGANGKVLKVNSGVPTWADENSPGIAAVLGSDTPEIDITITGNDTVGAVLKDGSIDESRLNIDNAPTAEYFLKSTGSSMVWAIASQATSANTVTASPTITAVSPLSVATDSGINSFTVSLTAIKDGQVYVYSSSQGKFLPLNFIASGSTDLTYTDDASSATLAIGSSGSSGGSSGNTIIPLLSVYPISTATYQIGSSCIILENNDVGGIDYGNFIIPSNWDGTSSFDLSFWARVTTGEASSNMVFRVDYFIIKSGSSGWTDGGYTTGSLATVSVANQTTYQKLSGANLTVPAAGLTSGDSVFLRLYRVGTNASDDYEQDVSIVSSYIGYNN